MFATADMNSSDAGIGFIYYENNEDVVLKVQTTLNKFSGIDVVDNL